MSITCQETNTITGSNSVMCGKLIRISDIRPESGTIDIFIEGQITPQVGDNTFTLGNEQVRLQLVSKDVSRGIAIVTITISTINNSSSTHHLDFYVKPHSWYSHGGAVDEITRMLNNITGAIVNPLSTLTGWEYVSTEIVPDSQNNRVIVRINLNELADMSAGIRSMAVPIAPIVITPIGIAIAIVILGVGTIMGWSIIKAVQYVTGETYTGEQVGEMMNAIIDNAKTDCQSNFAGDPSGYANCVKSNTTAVTKAGGDFFKDPTITQAGINAEAKIDNCLAQYEAGQITAEQLKICTDSASDDAKKKITAQTKDSGGIGLGTIAVGVVGVGLIYYTLTRKKEST